MPQSPDNLVWVDLEMTGLDTNTDYIIEIATVITDPELRILEEGPVLAIHQDDETLGAMDEWNTRQHTRSGLVDRVRRSSLSAEEAARMTLEFVKEYVPVNTSPMCGNSICQDRRFMHRLMPELEAYFHYRNIDVSTLKELVQRWGPNLPPFAKKSSHLALDDIRDSIEELRYYRERVFKI